MGKFRDGTYIPATEGKKIDNIKKSRDILNKKKILFKENTNGHFILENHNFRARTGLFINKKTKARGRGIGNLIYLIEKSNKKTGHN